MINCIRRIQQIGRFESDSYNDLTFEEKTLIFGGNGAGKTTFASLMHGISRADPGFIEERRRVGENDTAPKLVMGLSGQRNPVVYEEGTWSGPLSELEIAVFDAHFVNENIYSGNVLQLEHKRSLHQFIIGSDGRAMVEKISRIGEVNEVANRRIRSIESEIQRLTESDCSAEEFVELDELEEEEEAIQAAQARLRAQDQAESIQNTDDLEELDWPEIPIGELRELLGQTVEDVQEEARGRVERHLAVCEMEEGGEAWIQEGRRYGEEGPCPFCGQNLEGSDLIEAYEQYFDQRYEDLTDTIGTTDDQIRQSLSDRRLSDLLGHLDTNEARAAFWDEHIEDEYNPAGDLDTEIEEVWTMLRTALLELLARKQQAPLEEFVLSEEVESALARFGEVGSEIEAYNELIRSLNEQISEQKEEAEGGSVKEARSRLNRLEDRQLRYGEKGQALANRLMELKQLKESLSTEKDEQKERLQGYQEDLLSGCEEEINHFLHRVKADFRLRSTEVAYPGGRSPTTEYAIDLNGEEIPIGHTETGIGTQRFGNLLSDGDRSTLAFAFFCARLQQTGDLAEHTLVIDDPISSLDDHRRRATQTVIDELAEEAAQVIVLSHNPEFLHGLWEKWHDEGGLALFRFRKRGDQTSTLTAWPADEMKRKIEDPYYRRFNRLLAYRDEEWNGDPRDVARDIRDVLEGNLARRFPEELARSSGSIGTYLNRIRQAGPDSPLAVLAEDPYFSMLEELEEFCQPPHHSSDPYRSETINEDELTRFVRDTLEFVRGPLPDR